MTWKTVELERVCEFISRGVSPVYTESEEGSLIILNQKCIRNHKVDTRFSKRHDINSKSFNSRYLIREGDVLVNSTGTGTLGRLAQVKGLRKDVTVDSHITILRPERALFNLDFFGWMLISIEESIVLLGEGASGQTELSRESLKKSAISYPESVVEQKRLATLLTRNFTELEKVKESLGKNLQNSRELFDSYQKSIFTNTKRNWESKKLSDCFQLKSGDSMTSKMMTSGGKYPVYGGNGISGYHKSFNLAGSNVVIGRVGALCGNVRYIKENIWLTDNAFKVVNYRTELDPAFLVYYLNFINLRKFARQAAQPVISNSSLEGVLLSYPRLLNEQKVIVEKLDSLSSQTQALESLYKQKLALLEELKKSILHKAFSGEL